MPGFRYAQFCPIARAAEIVGERWTLLVVRELMFGPQRFSDLREALPAVSTSVLSERLRGLEERGLVARRTLPPPTPVTVYELTEIGVALRPALFELARWGLRFLDDPEPGDQLTPKALRMGLHFASSERPTPARRFALHAVDDVSEERIAVQGGPDGTRIEDDGGDAAVRVRGHPYLIVGLAVGKLDAASARRAGVEIEGDVDALADLPRCFDWPDPQGSPADPQPTKE